MDIMFGQYANLDTFLHRLHPLTKLLGLVVFIVLTFLFSNFYIYLIQLLGFFLLIWFTGLPLNIVFKNLWRVRYLFLFLFIFNVLFIRDGAPLWQWGIFAFYPQAMLLTLNLIMRLLLLTTYTSVFTLTTNPLDLTTALADAFSFLGNGAYIIGMILALALRFIPTLQSESAKIMKAQTSRGARFSEGTMMQRAKDLITLLIPLLIISFSRADTLAVAMELRGYNPNEERTHFRTLHWMLRDNVICIALMLSLVGAIAMRIVL